MFILFFLDYHRLMLVADCLTTLFFPFTWVKTYVPIVPSSNLYFIEAPFPYIMGFYNPEIDRDYFIQGQRCFVDIDSGTVTCPEGLPDFPNKSQFVKEINEILLHFATNYKASLKATSATLNNKKKMVNQKCKNRSHDLNDVLHKKNPPTIKLKKEKALSDDENDDGIDEGCDIDTVNGDTEVDVYEEVDKISNHESSEDIYNSKDEHDDEEDEDGYSILEKSQAFARISELARKAGAINEKHNYLVDSTVDRMNKNRKKFSNNHTKAKCLTTIGIESASSSSSSSSGISIHRSSNNSQSSNAQLASTTRSIVSLTFKENSEHPFSPEEIIKMQFSHAIRELVLQHFIHLFFQYEKFVILPPSDVKNINEWYINREYMDNFDAKMFLIEQPSPYLPFLSHFISTQMFVSFIDSKIMSLYQHARDLDVTVSLL
jgi:hypothetical protein